MGSRLRKEEDDEVRREKWYLRRGCIREQGLRDGFIRLLYLLQKNMRLRLLWFVALTGA